MRMMMLGVMVRMKMIMLMRMTKRPSVGGSMEWD